MQNELSIALLQTNLIWKDKASNLSILRQLADTINETVDIIVLPELFNTAFCIDDLSLAEDVNGETMEFLKSISTEKNCAVCGSFLFNENEKVYNRFFFVAENEIKYYYNKHYLFSLVGEDKLLTKGVEKIIIDYRSWKIQPFICYDIRFPAWCQNDDNADLQIYVASWPEKRIHHWQTLLQARAIENQCYTTGVNRIGSDFYGNAHNGHSSVYDFTGNKICDMQAKNGIEIVKISKVELDKHKERYPFWKDR
ncbi:MAG: nitrilase-related carbon-nitrogen hydrolase [Chitinophagales bacterium]